MNKYTTEAGIELTDQETKAVRSLSALLKKFPQTLSIYAMSGTLHVGLVGDSERNPHPEMRDNGGLNYDNMVVEFNSHGVLCDGGDW